MKTVTRDEAFILRQKSNLDGACNGVCGLLRDLANRLPTHHDPVQGDVREFLRGLADRLSTTSELARTELLEYLGEDRRTELFDMEWTAGISMQQTWKRGYPSDVDGEQVTNTDTNTERILAEVTEERTRRALTTFCDNESDRCGTEGVAYVAAECILNHLEADTLPVPIQPLWQGIIDYALEMDGLARDQ
jgi:hypothetical protein